VIADFETLMQHVYEIEKEIGTRLSGGRMGTKHNTYAHRSRLIRRARGKLNDLHANLTSAESL